MHDLESPRPVETALRNKAAMNARTFTTALLVALLAALLLSGCGSPGASSSSLNRTAGYVSNTLTGNHPTTGELFPEDETPLVDLNYHAADVMMGTFPEALNKNSPIYFEPFTNRVNMGDTAPFGVLISEQVVARLALRHFKVTQGPPRKDAPAATQQPVEPQGVSPSSDDAKPAAKPHLDPREEPRPSLLSGTYLIAGNVIYISASITALNDGQVMAAHSWTVPVNRTTRALLPQLKPTGGMKPAVRTQLKGNAHEIANPSGQPQNYVGRDLVR